MRALGLLIALLVAACTPGGTPDGGGSDGGRDMGVGDARTDARADVVRECTMGRVQCGTICVDTQTDRANCGMCGNLCPLGETCREGACERACPAGQSACGTTCRDLQTDMANCGACGNACTAGQMCIAGMCRRTCPAGEALCGTTCVNIQTDMANCGACGVACAAGSACMAGVCRPTCPTGQALCGGACVDVQTDNANCGSCGTACPAGRMCAAGMCACPAGQALCGDACVNTQGDNANCGTCGNACTGGRACEAGACVCPAGQSFCGGACVDTQSSTAHCGACSNACGAGQVCSGGTCGATCTAPRTMCGTRCTDTATDSANCGACGTACSLPNATAACASSMCAIGACSTGFGDCDANAANGCETDTRTSAMHCGACGTACPAGQVCNGGMCGCPTGQALCGGACVNVQTDNANCGTCGTACTGEQTCMAGMCACPAGRAACGGACVDTQTDNGNCGACGTACTGGQACAAGACACPAGQTSCAGACVDTRTSVAHCGGCGMACMAGQVCVAGACMVGAPPNDTRATAITIPLASPSATLTTDTSSATNETDGACGCTSGNDVFWTFTLTVPEIVYADTYGTAWDTSLFFQNAMGANVTDAGIPGGAACDDDSALGCTTPTGRQSAIAAALPAGTYFLVLSGCGSGPAAVHFQHLPLGNGPSARLAIASGTQSVMGTTTGTGRVESSFCSGGPENTYWWNTCPMASTQLFHATTCGGSMYDTALDQRSAARSPVSSANDDARTNTCVLQSSVSSALPSGAGLHTLYADSCIGSGAYTLRYSAGACVTGFTDCGGTCRDLQSDDANCGGCGTACAADTRCLAGACRPVNDARTSALVWAPSASETTLTGTTAGATPDGPGSSCACTTGTTRGDVWHRFTLTTRAVVYADTAGSMIDTGVYLADSTGAAIADACNDDAGCTTGGFTAANQSQLARVLAPGTYYWVVTNCFAGGRYQLHLQYLPTNAGAFFYESRLSGDTSLSDGLISTSRTSSTCGGSASGEDARWFTTCGGQPQFFSLCRADGGAYTRRRGATFYDPAIYVRSALTGSDVSCNDDGPAGTDCRGTFGTALEPAQFGSRLNNVLAPRGLNAIFVDERTGGSTGTDGGMSYTLRYTIR